jgi:hypothetical protein
MVKISSLLMRNSIPLSTVGLSKFLKFAIAFFRLQAPTMETISPFECVNQLLLKHEVDRNIYVSFGLYHLGLFHKETKILMIIKWNSIILL